VASSLDPVRADRGLTVTPTDTPERLPDPDLIVVPGSENPLPVLEDQRILLGDRPVQMAARITRQIVSARLGRARRALSGRHAS
jgi:cobyric acid synthase